MHDPFIARLIQAIIKTGTQLPMARSSVMDVSAFTRMFHSWPDNHALSLKDLRLKVLTLLAIALMLRPSDVAPKAEPFDTELGAASPFIMSTDQINFQPDGSLQVTFMGIKNDSDRSGFRVTLPAGADVVTDPVCALRAYLHRTESLRDPVTKPVFLGLARPHCALSASSIARILREAIFAAEAFGLAPGHKPKDFRPTGATRAVQLGFNVDQVQRLGRWKTRSVFMEHYVHADIDGAFTTAILK